MALSFPRTMPTVGAHAIDFEPERVDYLSPENGGRIGAVTAGFPRWRMAIELNAMFFADSDVWRAWVAAQRGGARQFYARDLDRPGPAYHLATGIPWQDTPSSWSHAVASDGQGYLTLNGLNAGQKVTMGDYTGFKWSTWKRSLVRAVETVVANGSGVATFAIEPTLPSLTPGGATATLANPDCIMRLVSGDTRLARQALGYTEQGGTISAVQELIA